MNAAITTADVTRPRGETAQSRITTIMRIAELIGRYRHEQDPDTLKFHVYDVDAHGRLPGEYADEPMARAGARLAAASDIRALFDPK